MPSVIVRQTIDLYGTRYRVGLRDIPAGHQCGHEWEFAVASGFVEAPQKPAEVAPVSGGVAEFAALMNACDELAAETEQPEQVVEKTSRKKRG